MKLVTFALTLLLCACNTTPHKQSNELDTPISTPQVQVKQEQVSESQKVYYFQHKILPEWTYASEGLFFEDLTKGNLEKVKQAASDVISKDYANQITSQYYPEFNAALIVFPTPKAFTHCFFILITKNKEKFNFYTYEKTLSFSENDPIMGVVGTWSEDDSHGNLGGRTYTLANDFVKDIMQ